MSCSKKNKISYTFEAKYDCRNNNFGFELSHNQSCKPVFSKGNFLGLVNAPVMCILNFLNSNSYFSKFNYSYLNFSNFYLSNTNFSKNLGQNTEIQAFIRLFWSFDPNSGFCPIFRVNQQLWNLGFVDAQVLCISIQWIADVMPMSAWCQTYCFIFWKLSHIAAK